MQLKLDAAKGDTSYFADSDNFSTTALACQATSEQNGIGVLTMVSITPNLLKLKRSSRHLIIKGGNAGRSAGIDRTKARGKPRTFRDGRTN
jgi:hypothetical protein